MSKLESLRDLKPVKMLIIGESGHGKTESLKNIPEPEGVLYVDLDGKGLPFEISEDAKTFASYGIKRAEEQLLAKRREHAALLQQRKVQDNKYIKMSPVMFLMNQIGVLAGIPKKDADGNVMKDESGAVVPHFHTIVIDTFSYLMTLFEVDIKKDEYTNKTKSGSADGQANWGQYKDFVSEALLEKLSGLPQHIICLNHINKDTGVAEVSGSWKHKTLESSFATTIRAMKLDGMYFDKLKDSVKNDLLSFTQKDNYFGRKFVFKVLPHPDFDNLSERTTENMFKVEFDETGEDPNPVVNEAFIDNDIMIVLQRMYEFTQKSTPKNQLNK